jgi:hypothetical protein
VVFARRVVRLSYVKEDGIHMKSCETFNLMRSGKSVTDTSDTVGLISDVLEPSARYGGLSVHPTTEQGITSHSRERCGSLSELRAPRSWGRVASESFSTSHSGDS